jgi:outer membrane protein
MRRFLSLLLVITAFRSEAATNVVKSLTLRECIQRALANNLDIKLESINPSIAQWGITSAQSVFDPLLTGSANYTDTRAPGALTNAFSRVEQQQLNFNLGLAGKIATGTGYDITGYDTRTSGNGVLAGQGFVYAGGPSLTLTQPLLKNFGFGPNTALIRMARQTHAATGQQFLQQVINTISSVNDAYYELVYAIEYHKSTAEDLGRAQALLDENKKRLRIGVMSPLDVVQAEAGVAEREEAVLLAAQAITDAQNALIRLISQDVAEFRGVKFIPTDYPAFEAVDLDIAANVRIAMEKRPDIAAARFNLERQHIYVKYNRNQLWPEVDLKGSIGWSGSATSLGGLANSVGSGDFPGWGVGVTVTFPIGNRQAKANYQTSKLQADQQVLSLKSLEQDIIVSVDTTVGRVQTNLKRIDATRAASRLAAESLKAEETKLRAGTSTSFLVLQAQSQLALALSAEIRARADYAESLVELARVTGTTLERQHITLAEER